jgi:hypothetical protein
VDPHLGIKVRNKEDGLKLTAENYVQAKDKDVAVLSEEFKLRLERVMARFDANMRYFKTLSRDKFNEELDKFIALNNFRQIKDLNYVESVAGHYVMVLDEYCQVYIGTSSYRQGIKERIPQHWRKRISLDKLEDRNFGSLPIGSFKPLDTTRIFVWSDDEYTFSEDYALNEYLEGRLVAQFPIDYCLNEGITRIPRELARERLKQRDLKDLRIYGKDALTEFRV